MALAEDVRALAASSVAELDAAHDYHAHTRTAWRLVQEVVARGGTFVARNPVTGTVADQKSFADLGQRYVSTYLAAATFQHFVAVFEDFVFGLLRLWLTAYPGSLSEKEIKFGLVLRAPDKDAITQAVVDRELNELKYERVSEWFVYLDRRAKLGVPEATLVEALAEIKASRDILAHNNGVVNAVYLAKAGSRARYREGERLEISEGYHRLSWETIKMVIRDLAEVAAAKS